MELLKFKKFSDEFPDEDTEFFMIETTGGKVTNTYTNCLYKERSKRDFEECYIYYSNFKEVISTDKGELRCSDYYWMYNEDFHELLFSYM